MKFRKSAYLVLLALAMSSGSARADERTDKLVALVNQGWSLIAQHKNQEAIVPLEQAFAITGDPATPSPETAYVLKALGTAYVNTGVFDKAETYNLRAVEIEAAVFGEDDVRDIEGLANVGILYARQNKNDKAEPYFQKALEISQAKLGPDSRQTAMCLASLGQLYMQMGKTNEANALFARAAAINPALQ